MICIIVYSGGLIFVGTLKTQIHISVGDVRDGSLFWSMPQEMTTDSIILNTFANSPN